MHIKMKNTPCRLGGRDIPALDPACNLIAFVSDLETGHIAAFLDVLEGILEGPKRDGALDVDVAVVLGREPRTVGYNP
jgi:hypothetical protein